MRRKLEWQQTADAANYSARQFPADLWMEFDGSIVVFHCTNSEARYWARECLQTEHLAWLGTMAFAVNRRYAEDVMLRAIDAGYTVRVRQ